MSKRYKIIKSDLCIAGKIYKEGTEVNFKDDKLEQYFQLVPEKILNVSETASEVSPAALEPMPFPDISITIPKRTRVKKVTEDPVVEQQI